MYRDNIQLKDASVNVSSEAFDSKRDIDDGLPVYDDEDSQDGRHWGDSDQDKRDMQRMGKKQVRKNRLGRLVQCLTRLQEFKRNFSLVSAIAFVSVYMATWEFVLVSLSVGFSNGGYAGLFWCFITTVLCYATIVASLAEMESMAPTAGGKASITSLIDMMLM